MAASTLAVKSAELLASRTALVATISMRAAPNCRASVTMRCTADTAESMADSESAPVVSSPSPRRGMAFISSTTRMAPAGDTSATICRTEFEPMSMAAIRTSPLIAAGTVMNRPGGLRTGARRTPAGFRKPTALSYRTGAAPNRASVARQGTVDARQYLCGDCRGEWNVPQGAGRGRALLVGPMEKGTEGRALLS